MYSLPIVIPIARTFTKEIITDPFIIWSYRVGDLFTSLMKHVSNRLAIQKRDRRSPTQNLHIANMQEQKTLIPLRFSHSITVQIFEGLTLFAPDYSGAIKNHIALRASLSE